MGNEKHCIDIDISRLASILDYRVRAVSSNSKFFCSNFSTSAFCPSKALFKIASCV